LIMLKVLKQCGVFGNKYGTYKYRESRKVMGKAF